MTEEERQAATLKVGISNYVGSAALAIIAGGIALYTYISQTFDVALGFDVLMFVALGALVIAIFLGGLGSDQLSAHLAAGTWTKDTRGQLYNFQALLTLLGLLLVLIASIIGVSAEQRSQSTDRRLDRLTGDIARLEVQLRNQSATVEELQRQVRQLRGQSSQP